MKLGLIDSHAHLDYDYDVSTQTLIDDAKEAGIEHIITISAEPDSLERAHSIASTFDNVFHTSGIHPHEAKDLTDDLFEKVKHYAKSKRCVAIGELGLDYHYNHSPKKAQQTAMQRQLELSVESEKPIVLHTRESEDDTLPLLKEHSQAWKPSNRPPGVLHCFSSQGWLAEKALELGYYVSFSGMITFKKADEVRATVRDIVPLDKMLVETDSPFLAPIPYRGKKNKPQYTREVAEKVAEIKGVTLEEVAQVTRKNTIHLFQLPIE